MLCNITGINIATTTKLPIIHTINNFSRHRYSRITRPKGLLQPYHTLAPHPIDLTRSLPYSPTLYIPVGQRENGARSAEIYARRARPLVVVAAYRLIYLRARARPLALISHERKWRLASALHIYIYIRIACGCVCRRVCIRGELCEKIQARAAIFIRTVLLPFREIYIVL